MPDTPIISDGSIDFSGGVDSLKTPTVASQSNPNGLGRNQLSWLGNATVRDGGISPRAGWQFRGTIADGSAVFQDAVIYSNPFQTPYIMAEIGGHLLKIDPDFATPVVELSSGLTVNPTGNVYSYMQQAEEFMIIQAGDYGTIDPPTLPLFWDGTTLRRSTGNSISFGTVNIATVAPAVGFNVVITLDAPYTGPVNQVIILNGATYIQVIPDNFYTIKNINNSNLGQVIPGGTTVLMPDGSTVGKLLVSFVVPAIGANINVKITPGYTGPAPPQAITILTQDWEIQTVGTIPPAANEVYLVNVNDTPGNTIDKGATLFSVQELPAAKSMDYYQGRLWYAQGRLVTAGDIVGDQFSGSIQYNFRDAVLKVTENPLAVGGDGFTIPEDAGEIRGIKHSANLDATLGQGNLFIGTTKSIYSLSVPINRTDWIAAGTNNTPLMTVVQINNGFVNDRSVVAVNGDLFYQSLEPAVRSLISAIKYYGQWGNRQISANENRILQFNDRALMRFSTGCNFDNRMLQAVLPRQTPQGVVHDAVLPLDFIPVSSFGAQNPPVWEGHYEYQPVLKLLSGSFGGRERAFAIAVSKTTGSIDLWEITNAYRFDNQEQTDGGNRIPWYAEFPAFNDDRPFDLKDLISTELWVDKLIGTVDFLVEYRPDGDVCWHFWTKFRMCSARNTCETVRDPNCYPTTPARESYRSTITLPLPPRECSTMNRPVHRGMQFQIRVTVKGYCRIRGLIEKMTNVIKPTYENMTCGINFLDKNVPLPRPEPAPQPLPPPPKDVLGDPILGDIFGDPNTGDVFGG